MCYPVGCSIEEMTVWLFVPNRHSCLEFRYNAESYRKGVGEVTKPIPDKAEVALEYPDKFYIGTFERSARFDAHADATGISLILERTGDLETRKSVHMHIHYDLLAEILCDLARTISAIPADDVAHREKLSEAAKALHKALVGKTAS
jgi:hypothetical protein